MFSPRVIAFSLAAVIVVITAGWFGGRYWFYSFLKSDTAVEWLNQTTSAAIGGEARFSVLQPQSLDSIYCEEVTLRTPLPPLLLRAEQLRADVRFSFFSRSCVVQRLDITRLHLTLGEAAASDLPAALPSRPSASERFSLQQISSADFNVNWPTGALRKSTTFLSADREMQGIWHASGGGGNVRLEALPGLADLEWRMIDYKARLQGDAFHLVNASLRYGQETTLTLQGSQSRSKGGEWTVGYARLPLEKVSDGDWRARINGTVSGTLELTDRGAALPPLQQGTFEIHDGILTALPLLDALARFTQTDRLRRLPLHRASARFTGSAAEGYTVSEINLESNGLVRLEGSVMIRNRQVDGTVQLGLTPGIVRRFPGGAAVFTTEREGYLWAPVTLSGPIASPSEDLSPRLLRAATGQVVEQTSEVIRQGTRGVKDATKGVLDSVAPLLPIPIDPSSLLE